MCELIDVFIILRRSVRFWPSGCMPILFDCGSLLGVAPHRLMIHSRFVVLRHSAPLAGCDGSKNCTKTSPAINPKNGLDVIAPKHEVRFAPQHRLGLLGGIRTARTPPDWGGP